MAIISYMKKGLLHRDRGRSRVMTNLIEISNDFTLLDDDTKYDICNCEECTPKHKELVKSVYYSEEEEAMKFFKTDDDINNQLDLLLDAHLTEIESLKQVSFIKCASLAPETIVKVLSRLNFIESIVMYKTSLKMDEFDVKKMPAEFELSQLTEFIIRDNAEENNNNAESSDDGYLKLAELILAKSENLEYIDLHLKADETAGDGDFDRFAELRRGIARQANLRMAILPDIKFFDGPVENVQCQLKNFCICINDKNPESIALTESQHNNIVNFLKSQTELKLISFQADVTTITDELKNLYNFVLKYPVRAIYMIVNAE